MGLSPMPYEQVKRVVGLGLNQTFRELLGEERVPRALFLFRRKYEEVFRENTRLLPDVREVLETLHARGIRLAVATNKLGRFSREIFEHFGMEKLFAVIIGDGDVPQNKPDPKCSDGHGEDGVKGGLSSGDSIDIQTGKNAGPGFALPREHGLPGFGKRPAHGSTRSAPGSLSYV
jgi:phosphoglycolate phosphatase-like HAD superfamily hydrolase